MTRINGFAVDPSPKALDVRTFRVPGTEVGLPVRADVAPLLIGFAEEFHRRVEPLVPGCNWGYAFRPVRGSSRPSFHSAGIAIDLNAPKHPLGKRNTFTPRQAETIRGLSGKYGLRWGGDYTSRPDDMHVEVIVPFDQALARVRALQAPTPFTSTPDAPVLREGARGPSVKALQEALCAAGFACATDGVFGPATDRSVHAFQSKRGLTADGVVGPKTWAALRGAGH